MEDEVPFILLVLDKEEGPFEAYIMDVARGEFYLKDFRKCFDFTF